MNIEFEKNTDFCLLKLSGRLDATTVSEFDEKITDFISEIDKSLLLDLTEIIYVSSAGLRSILKIAKLSRVKNFQFILFGLNQNVYDVFKISGFTSLLKIAPDLDAAKTML